MDISKYINKKSGDSISHEEWNGVFSDIQDAINAKTESTAVTDVLIDGESAVEGNIAKINLEDKLKQIKDSITTGSEFYVNDVLTTPVNNVISLNSGNLYKLRGELNGCIEIGLVSDKPSNDTTIILDGIDIKSDKTHGICYIPTGTGVKDLNIIVSRDSINTIVLSKDAPIESDQEACILSNNNMRIAGCGYLTLINRGGHGIKASELVMSGHNHIYIEATHDGVHGGSLINIDNGVFFVNKANDAFGSGPTGAINVFGGKFYAYNISQNVFDSKTTGYYLNELEIDTDVNSSTTISGMSKYTNNVESGITLEYELKDGTLDSYVGCVLEEDQKTYTISNPTNSFTQENPLDKIILTLTGNFIDKSFVFNSDVKKVDVILNGVSITNEDLSCINYQAGKSRLKLKSSKDAINIFTSNGTSPAIASSNNAQIEVKSNSHFIINTKTSKGLTCSTFFITDSSGSLILNTADAGIEGSELYIGGDPESKDVDNTYFSGSIIASKLKARMSSKKGKGTFQIFDKYCIGSVYVKSIDTPSTIDFEKSDCVFYKIDEDTDNPLELTHSVVNKIPKVEETFEYIPYRKIPVISK